MKRRPEKQVPIERAGTRKKPRETAAKGHEMSRKVRQTTALGMRWSCGAPKSPALF